jgi:predicted DNA-binding protein
MKLKNKQRIEIFVTQETKDKLSEKADSLMVGVATIVKMAIEEYLKK